jgi:hypothetical protein
VVAHWLRALSERERTVRRKEGSFSSSKLSPFDHFYSATFIRHSPPGGIAGAREAAAAVHRKSMLCP